MEYDEGQEGTITKATLMSCILSYIISSKIFSCYLQNFLNEFENFGNEQCHSFYGDHLKYNQLLTSEVARPVRRVFFASFFCFSIIFMKLVGRFQFRQWCFSSFLISLRGFPHFLSFENLCFSFFVYYGVLFHRQDFGG